MSARVHSILAAMTLFGGTMAVAATAAGDDDFTSLRIQAYKTAKRSVGTIKDALSDGDLAVVGVQARKLADFAATLPELFPPGSGHGWRTNAKEEIWTNFPDFQAKADDFHRAALELAEAAESGDRGGANVKLGTLTGACKSCHDLYKD